MDEPEYSNENVFEQSAPHSIDAEKVLLGSILITPTLLLQAMELLEPDDLYLPSHNLIYNAMLSLFDEGIDIDPISISEELKLSNSIHRVGGVGDIAALTVGVPVAGNIAAYAKIITDKAKLRRLIKSAAKITQEAYSEEDRAEEILAHAENEIYKLTETRFTTQLVSIDKTLEQVIEKAESNIGTGLSVTGLRTGLNDLDNMTTGFQNSDLIILAARPGLGKTSEAVTIITNAALDYEKKVAFFSLEMGRDAIVARMLCNVAKVNFNVFRQGMMNHGEWTAVTEAFHRLNVNRIFLDDKPAITLAEAKAKIRKLELHQGLPDLIVFDYLQLMTGLKEHRRESRQQEISGISAGLKTLAKELDRPVLALSQLNRALEARSDKRPQLADLRESGSIEQDADMVLFIHKPKTDEENSHIMEQIVAKNRNGPTGSVGLYFNAPAMRFDNLQTG